MSSASINLFRSCRKIICVGRNYAEHAKELGNAVPTSPVLFLKPPSALLAQGAPILLPSSVTSLHHEVELGVVIGATGRDIPKEKVWNYVSGYVVALDLTARNLQDQAKKAGLPWTIAKGQDTFCPVSSFIPKTEFKKDPQNVELFCEVNGVTKQKGNTNQMIFPIANLLSHISTMFTLEEGDLILTGTPSGVGPLVEGDTITGGITGIPQLNFKFTVAKRPVPKL